MNWPRICYRTFERFTGVQHGRVLPKPKVKKNNKWDLPTVVNLNARSLSCEKMDELQITVETNNASIVCVTETWFKEYMDIHSLALEGFCLERKDRINGRGGGVACYIRNAINYKRLVDMEDTELEVMWIKIMPKKMPRKFTCILLACIYFTQQTVFSQMRDHIITCVDC